MATLAQPIDEGLAPARWSAAEFLRMADMGAFGDDKVELVEGEVFVVSPPGWSHSRMQAVIVALLMRAYEDTPFLVAAETGAILGPRTVRAFDAAVVRGEPGPGRLDPAAVLLGVEVADTTLARDLTSKARDYARAGIPHYWVLDVNDRVAHLFADPGPFGYGEARKLPFGTTVDAPGIDRRIALPE
jgi:Uma2 family endonuclease